MWSELFELRRKRRNWSGDLRPEEKRRVRAESCSALASVLAYALWEELVRCSDEEEAEAEAPWALVLGSMIGVCDGATDCDE